MPMNEREKKELEEKIKNQRRAMWKGEAAGKDKTKNSRTLEKQPEHKAREATEETAEQHGFVWKKAAASKNQAKTTPVSEEKELERKIAEQRRAMWQGQPDTGRERKRRESKMVEEALHQQQESERTEDTLEYQVDDTKPKRKQRNTGPRIPSLKLALLVIIGLIGAIIIGVAIGYLAAARNLIKI